MDWTELQIDQRYRIWYAAHYAITRSLQGYFMGVSKLDELVFDIPGQGHAFIRKIDFIEAERK